MRSINLLRPELEAARRRRRALGLRAAGLVAAGLALAAYRVETGRRLAAAQAAVAAARAEAAAAEEGLLLKARRDEGAAAVREREAFLEEVRRLSPVVPLLEAVRRAVPDDVVLLSLQLAPPSAEQPSAGRG
ncbi:MAG: hypothetical protein IRY95_06140, partial [Clostridia bacterium]|nr:hypothetical protein [Clostridia bacterium]